MGATTIKVSTELRDRINAVAAEQGLTAGSLVEKLLDDMLWRKKVELAKQQMRSASKEVWDDYLAEAQAWDVVAGDGLEDDPWEG
jgi:predicted transcriptional regulator